MLRRALALYNNSKVLSYHSSPLLYQLDSKNVAYFLYAMLLFQFVGEELVVMFTYFYLPYVRGGMAFALGPFARGLNSIPSQEPTSGRRAVPRMHSDEISALFLDVRIPFRTAALVLPLTWLSDHSYC
jgi:hypothetical protein